ncbi:MAG: pyrroline-5-carboxylate reductase [Lysobacteraceae bacterium]
MSQQHPIVTFIGGGNMARSLIGGLVAAGHPADRVRVVEPDAGLREALSGRFGVATFADAAEAAPGSQAWVLAVKPQVVRVVCGQLAEVARAEAPVVVSVAAGITTAQIQRWLGGEAAVVRNMPNTPALLGAGASGLYANAHTTPAQRALAQQLAEAVGIAVWVEDESLMDAVTAVSGSGPAYFFLFVEALQAAGEGRGLPAEAARRLAVQTALGAARMLAEGDEDAPTLRRRVTSPGGTTQAAIESFESGGLRDLVEGAVTAAAQRGADLSRAND